MSQHERSKSTGSRPALTHRYSAPHPNSSAFSASANANEDWTKISDLAERRRIQNRIAQRNYRKKLKRRLEDLERRASASPEPEITKSYSQGRRSSRGSLGPAPTSTTRYSPSRYSGSPEPAYSRASDRPSYLELPDDRHLSRMQPSFSYTSFGGSNDTSGHYPHSPSLSSYSVPSPALSAVSYANSYLSPGLHSESSVSSPTESTHIKTEYFGQDFNTYDYGYGAIDSQKRHLSAPSAFSSYPDGQLSYKHEFNDASDSFDSSLHGSPSSDLWNDSYFAQPMLEEPPFFQL